MKIQDRLISLYDRQNVYEKCRNSPRQGIDKKRDDHGSSRDNKRDDHGKSQYGDEYPFSGSFFQRRDDRILPDSDQSECDGKDNAQNGNNYAISDTCQKSDNRVRTISGKIKDGSKICPIDRNFARIS